MPKHFTTVLIQMPRKPFIKSLVIVMLLLSISACATKNPYYRPDLPHHTKTGFRNTMMPERVKKRGVMYWLVQLFEAKAGIEGLAEPAATTTPDLQQIFHPDPNKIQATWLGHSTVLIQYQGLNILTDPVFSKRVSPIGFIGPKRVIPSVITIEELPSIDVVVISHNHYDHLDTNSVKALGKDTLFLVPLGNKSWFNKKGIMNVVEQDWWGIYRHKGFIFRLTPAQHFTGRKIFDLRKSLWGGWAILKDDAQIYFAGDTGYTPQFKEIGARSGPFDLALIPIGAYAPRDTLRYVHIDPYEAAQTHRDVRSQKSIAIHWGTFRLTTEPLGEPIKVLSEAKKLHNVAEDDFLTIKVGETKLIEVR